MKKRLSTAESGPCRSSSAESGYREHAGSDGYDAGV